VASEVRASGLPGDHPTDVAYLTRLTGYELARLRQPTADQVRARTAYHPFTWPTPEPLHRASQLYVEPVLRRAAESWAHNRIQYSHTVTHLTQDAEHVAVSVSGAQGQRTVRARYLVGCDGPRSTVRGLLGLSYAGTSGAKREFMGGRMAAAYFSAPGLLSAITGGPAWQYWTINPEQRGLIVSVDGRETFTINIQLREGEQPDDSDVGRRIATAVGANIPFKLISNSEWTAGFALVAEKMRAGRVFLAGDAAHLFTPTGGLGYNTGIEDAANLAWKLEAAVKGQGGGALLDSYEAERRPASQRNTEFARQFADSIGYVKAPADLEDATPAGELARRAVGDYLFLHATREFIIPGVQLGTRFEDSPIVCAEPGNPPPDTANLYLPCGRPGHRAPHVWLEDGSSLYDRCGLGFTLLKLGAAANEGGDDGMPGLASVALNSQEARDLYGADYVLVRPDLHIAWRGNSAGAALAAALKQSLGG
jgi:2-polyprenyl-6-methoxyphenol hydroxylase-like FAD-dependent oxidoreductase